MALQVVAGALAIGYVRADAAARPWLAAGVVGLWLAFFGWAETMFRRSQRR